MTPEAEREHRRTLYLVTPIIAYAVPPYIVPGDRLAKEMDGGNPAAITIRVATRSEAEALWQSPLHAGWKVAE